jgi:hypothetical protein
MLTDHERNEIVDKVIDCINLLLIETQIGNHIRQWVKDKMKDDFKKINEEVHSIFMKLDELSSDSD